MVDCFVAGSDWGISRPMRLLKTQCLLQPNAITEGHVFAGGPTFAWTQISVGETDALTAHNLTSDQIPCGEDEGWQL